MSCFPACSPWCDCVNGVCVPSTIINAVRFRTPDGRYLQAANGGGGLLVAASATGPGPSETFLFANPATWPLASEASIALDVCNSNWNPSGLLVRVDHNVLVIPPRRKSESLVTYEVGGPGARVFVSGPFSAGYPAYPGDDPAERIFTLVKMAGAIAEAPPEPPPIHSGDQVVLRINSNRGKIFFFRVTEKHSGAEVHGDGTASGAAGTVFTAEFSEVRSGLGWRPADVKCQSCAEVTAQVTRASGGGQPIEGATVVAQVPDHPFQAVTASDGRALLIDMAGRKCVPDGSVQVQASADRHQTKTVNVGVPDAGAIEVPIQLDCTQVKGKVVDRFSSSAVPGVTVYLRDADRNVILDETGSPYRTTTAADGTFVFNCVPHGFVQVWTTADPKQIDHTKVIGPDGWINVEIRIQATCGNLVGRVTDADTGQPIAGATVTESGGSQTTTNANGEFKFQCVKPAGNNTVFASAPGYTEEFRAGVAPATGDSDPVEIKLRSIAILEFQIRLDWGTQPSDLDSHLSGPKTPNPADGRFHCFFSTPTPVPFVVLDVDDVTALGPETITIRRTPASAAGVFIAGEYRYWVHNFTGTTFDGSDATVSVSASNAQGNVSQIVRWDVLNATGARADGLWYAGSLTIDADGTVVRSDIQTFQTGDSGTVL